MLDMSWGEVMVIGAVALIVIGPKDLPKALRTVGNMVSKVRRMAAEFQGQFNEAMREAELDDVRRQLQGLNDTVSTVNQGFNPVQTIRDELKGAIDGPAAQPSTAPATPATPAPFDPALDLPPPPVPTIDDHAASVAASLAPPSDVRDRAEPTGEAASLAPSAVMRDRAEPTSEKA